MRFVELHDYRYSDSRERMLVNLDTVTCVQENCIMTIDGRSFNVKETLEQMKAYIRAINELECKYEKYFDKNSSEETAGEPEPSEEFIQNEI